MWFLLWWSYQERSGRARVVDSGFTAWVQGRDSVTVHLPHDLLFELALEFLLSTERRMSKDYFWGQKGAALSILSLIPFSSGRN